MIFLCCIYIFFFSLLSETTSGERKTYRRDDFISLLHPYNQADQIITLCKDDIDHSSDRIVIYTSLSTEVDDNRESACRYLTGYLRKHPESTMAACWLGSIGEQPVEAFGLARMTNRHKHLIPTKLLLLSICSKNLFRRVLSENLFLKLQTELLDAESSIQTLRQTDAVNSDTLRDLLSYCRYKGQYSQALGILDRRRQTRSSWVIPIEYAPNYALMNEFPKKRNRKLGLIRNRQEEKWCIWTDTLLKHPNPTTVKPI